LLCKADDVGLLPQGKDDNNTERKAYRKNALRLAWFGYNYEWSR